MGALWFEGYTVLEIESLCSERFFNLCEKKGIRIHKLHPNDDKCVFVTSIDDFYTLKGICRKTKPHLRILKKRGWPFVMRRILGHKFFLAGTAIFAVILYILSLFVWNISISGNYMNTDDTIYRYLENMGITYGTAKKNIDCEALEAQIRRDFDDIIWVSAALSGTRLDIAVRENQDEVISVPDGSPSNITAAYGGIIKSVFARRGTPNVRAGDVVTAGDVIISGIVITLNESNEPVDTRYVYADGDVEIMIKLPYERQLARNYIKKEYTGHSYKTVTLRAGRYNMDFKPYYENYEYEDEYGESWILCPYQDFYMPLGAVTTYHREYTLTESLYTDEELFDIMNADFLRYLQKLEEKGIQIAENNVTIDFGENGALMYGDIYAVDKAFNREEIYIEHN